MTRRTDNAASALLPAGMSDLLPPEAAFEARVIEHLMSCFAAYGYERIKPPLMEFEESLLRGPGAATANDAFRLMDPVSQRMMAIRADMTPQIARIAGSRLGNAPRPLRLSYAGQILRVRGTQLRGARQFGQVGVEIIGADTQSADTEVILMAAESLTKLGIAGLSVDLCTPTLVPAVCNDLGLSAAAMAALKTALDRKDAAGIEALRDEFGDDATELFAALLAATGDAVTMMDRLAAIDLGPGASRERDALQAVVSIIHEETPDLAVTIDPVERRGWEYHSGISFTFFAKGARGELGAGGRYVTGDTSDTGDTGVIAGREPATGLTLFTDTLLQALSADRAPSRIYLPNGTPTDIACELRDEGWVTVQGLAHTDDDDGEAQRLGCSHVFTADGPQPVQGS